MVRTIMMNPGLYEATAEEVMQLIKDLAQDIEGVGVFNDDDACVWCGALHSWGGTFGRMYDEACEHDDSCPWLRARTLLTREERVRQAVEEVHQSIKRALSR